MRATLLRRSAPLAALLLLLGTSATRAQVGTREDDLAAARELFERNLRAIQERDREAYVACYHESEDLVRTEPEGTSLGWAGLAAGAPATGSDDWPVELVGRDLRLHWIESGLVYGTYRYRTDFGDSLGEGLSERLFKRTEDGWKIVVTTAFAAGADVPAPPLALVGATLYGGPGDSGSSGGEPLRDAVIVTRGGRIESVGPRATTPVPAGVDVIDLGGKFVAPGLIDAHVHYSQTGWADGRPDSRDVRDEFPYEQVCADNELHPERFHRAFLAAGITAVFDVGGYPWTRRLGAAAETDSRAPHVAATGPLLSTLVPEVLTLPDRSQFVLMSDEDSVRRAIRAHAAAGSAAIKVWFVVRGAEDVERFTPLVHVAGEEARAHGLPLVVHATELAAARVALEAGAHMLVHSVEDLPVDPAFVDAAVRSGVVYCPTLTVAAGYLWLYRAELPPGLEPLLDGVDPGLRARVLRTRDLGPALDADRLERIAARQELQRGVMFDNLLRLHRAGVPIALGTDAGNPLTLHGPSIHAEAEAMQAAGLTAREVLTAATRGAARAMGREADLGRLAPGFLADLIVLDRDPGADIANLRSLTHVMRAGHLQRRATIAPR